MHLANQKTTHHSLTGNYCSNFCHHKLASSVHVLLVLLSVLRLPRISIYLVCTLFVNILYLIFTNIVAWINGPFFVIFKNNYKFTRTEKDSKKKSHLSFTQYSPMVTSYHNYTKISEAEIWYGAICVFIVLCHLITYVNFYNWHCNRDTEPLYSTLKPALCCPLKSLVDPSFPASPTPSNHCSVFYLYNFAIHKCYRNGII